MTRSKPVSSEKSVRPPEGGGASGAADGVLSLVHSGMRTLDELAGIYSKVSSVEDRRREVETDNAVKMLTAETDGRKEDNRHIEQMARLEQEVKRLSDSAEDREARLSVIRVAIDVFQAEYNRYLSLDQDTFLDESTRAGLESLRKDILALTRELIKAS